MNGKYIGRQVNLVRLYTQDMQNLNFIDAITSAKKSNLSHVPEYDQITKNRVRPKTSNSNVLNALNFAF